MTQAELTPVIIPGSRLGDGILKHHFNVGLPPWDEIVDAGDRAHERIFVPAVAAMAARAAADGVDRYGTLQANLPGTNYSANIGPLRMICAYDVVQDFQIVRFDVIGGSSPHGLAIARRMRTNDLKRWIRRRIGTYRPVPLPA